MLKSVELKTRRAETWDRLDELATTANTRSLDDDERETATSLRSTYRELGEAIAEAETREAGEREAATCR